MSLLLEQLKRKSHSVTERGRIKGSRVFFQLLFDDNGAYLQVVNNKGQVVEFDYRLYAGAERDMLKTLEHIRDRQSFVIDWEKPVGRVYLMDYDSLIWYLKRLDNFVDKEFRPIHFVDEPAVILVQLSGEDHITTEIFLRWGSEFLPQPQILSETHALVGQRIFTIPPIGEFFSRLNLFRMTLSAADLEKYLSLLCSYFENLKIVYNDLEMISGEPKDAQATLLFEKIDADNTLHLRVSTSLPGFDPDFFEEYEVRRVVVINELENKLVVSAVNQSNVYESIDNIGKMLSKHRKNLSDKRDFYLEFNLFLIEENLASVFIHEELPGLIANYAIFGAEKLKSYKVRAVTPRLNLRLSHGIDFLEGEATLDIEGEIISLFEAISSYHKNSYITLSDGTHAIINHAYMSKLERIFRKKKDKVKVSFFDLPLVEEMIDEKVAQASFQKSRQIFQGFNRLKDDRSRVPQIKATLRPYQQQGFRWLNYLHEIGLGGCLADDMGLGKTVQTIVLLSGIYPKQKTSTLIIMPRSLLFNWENEVRRFNPNLTFYTYYGQNRDIATARNCHLIFTTYGMVRNDIEIFKMEKFYYLVLDESQNIKNIDSQTTKAVMLLNGKHRLALSGTPIENNLGELYSLFRFLNPPMFGSVEEFNRMYATPIQRNNDKDTAHELRQKIYPFVLRRLKKHVLTELPDKIEQILYVDMSPEQKQLYEQRRQFYYQTVRDQIARNGLQKSQFFILQALSELRQLASIPEAKTDELIVSPKRELLLENLMDATAIGHKALIFANFLSVIDHVAADLENAGISCLTMTGATQNRKQLVEQFQNDPTCKVFLMTLKTGGLGLNLTAADYIFIFDPWWNKAAENQAIDRTHRIGQDKTVFSYKLIVRGTIEEKILQLQEKKSALFDQIIATDNASIKALDENDIEFMLGNE